jgi:uncharacterized RDD family membrane protein YckC
MDPQASATYGWQRPPEQVGPAPGIRFAGHGARLMAYIVDTIVIFAVMAGLFAVLGGITIGAAATESWILAILGFVGWLISFFAVGLLYFPLFWWKGGQTPGMRLFHLRVVRDRDGGPLSGGQASLRLLGYWVNGVVFYVGFAWILIDSRRRGWHDLIAQTCVIEDP